MQSIIFELDQIIDNYITFKPNRIYDNKIKNEFSDLGTIFMQKKCPYIL